jgi:hypothetical protein
MPLPPTEGSYRLGFLFVLALASLKTSVMRITTLWVALLCAGCAVPHDVSGTLTRDDCALPAIGVTKAAALYFDNGKLTRIQR